VTWEVLKSSGLKKIAMGRIAEAKSLSSRAGTSSPYFRVPPRRD
jgi:hypothetical protein